MSAPLDAAALAALAPALPDWDVTGEALTRTLDVGSFRDALALLVRVGFEAEEINHHPEIENVYGRLTFRLRTHDAGNRVTERDADLARRIDRCAAPFCTA